MSIEVNVPTEIDDYKEKIIFGLTLRKLISLVIAIVFAILCGWLCVGVLGISITVAGYIIFIIVMPPLAVGFFPVKGMPFEQYAGMYIRWMLHGQRKHINDEGEHKNVGIFAKGAESGAGSKSELTRTISGRSARQRRKSTRNRIRAARKAQKAAIQRTKECAGEHPL